MPFPFDIYPWANYQELNLAFFIARFQEIFRQWAALLEDMEAWKAQTETDIGSWETGVLSDLDAWKTDFQELFDRTFSDLQQIKTDAEAARDLAQGYASDAQGYAQSASDSAASVSASAAQIATNTGNIESLQSTVSSLPAIYWALRYNESIHLTPTAESPVDADTLALGNYTVADGTTASHVTHGPSIDGAYVGWKMIVCSTQSSSLRCQIALLNSNPNSNKPRLAIRHKASAGWSPWQYIRDQNYIDVEVTRAISDSLSLRSSDRIAISSSPSDPNNNINEIWTPGNYSVPSAAVASAMTGTVPTTTVGFDLIVMHTSASNRYAQIAILNRSTSSYYDQLMIRISTNGSSWGRWQTVAIAENVNAQLQQITDDLALETSARESADTAIQSLAVMGNPVHYVDASNVSTYFPTGSYNDATGNSIYRITEAAGALLSDGPEGDAWVAAPPDHLSRGVISGTLLTYSINPPDGNGVVQLLIGYRAASSYTPTLSWRIGRLVSGSHIWSAWSKTSGDMPLRASNTICYAGTLADYSFADMDDMPRNQIVQLDLNLDGSDADHTLLHHPFPGKSCVAMCYAFSTTTEHGKVQTVYCIDGRMAWRYGYFQSSNDYRWTNWVTIPKLPDIPSSDGSYVLGCTVSSGTASLAWVSAT